MVHNKIFTEQYNFEQHSLTRICIVHTSYGYIDLYLENWKLLQFAIPY